MAVKVKRIRLHIDLDDNENPTSVSLCRYRLEDDTNPGVRLRGGGVSLSVADLNKIAHNAGSVGELIKDIIDAARAAEGL